MRRLYPAFLNDLSDAGLPNNQDGTYLLACPMPHERGGCLHQNQADEHWTVSDGYDDHPVYLVTWIGAALFAAAHGGRLPLPQEMIE